MRGKEKEVLNIAPLDRGLKRYNDNLVITQRYVLNIAPLDRGFDIELLDPFGLRVGYVETDPRIRFGWS